MMSNCQMVRRIFLIVASCAILFLTNTRAQASNMTEITLFWAEGCPHCAAESKFLEELIKKYPATTVMKYEISKNRENQKLFVETGHRLNADTAGVPLTVIGDKYWIGFSETQTGREIEAAVEARQKEVIITGNPNSEVCTIEKPCADGEVKVIDHNNRTRVEFPFLGERDVSVLSLPALTVVLGALDGFNPCAMWTLIFLISLLLGMKDRKRMWVLGAAFIIASAVVYFIFMSAWLNLLIFIGFIATVRAIIGLVALGGGVYNIKDFLINRDGVCKLTGNKKRGQTFENLKKVVHEKSLILALLGIIILAFAVNLVELICSAGLPAVYTQVLTLSSLPIWQYYLYILIYIFFFMLDDLIVFFIAMFTLQLTGVTTKYSRISRLVGGIVMLLIGFMLVFKPELLMFG